MGEYDVYGRFLLRTWQAQAADLMRQENDSQVVVAALGDSWISNGRITDPLAAWFHEQFGNAGSGYASFDPGNPPSSGVTVVRTGEWVDSDQQPTSRGIDIADSQSLDAATPAGITIVAPCHNFVIHYLRQPGGGDFRVRVGTDDWTTIQTFDERTQYATYAVNGLDGASRSLQIEIANGSTAGVTLMGVDCQRSDRGARLHKLGNGGATAAQYAAVSADTWQAGLTALSPHLVLILLGTNDAAQGHPPAGFGDALSVIIDRIRSALPLASIILVSPAENGLAPGTYPFTAYVDEMRHLAPLKGVAFLDLALDFGPYDENTWGTGRRDLYADLAHLNVNGGEVAAGLLIERLLRVR